MKFSDFRATVQKFRPDVEVFPHGEFAECRKNKKVSVIFNYGKPNESRVYDYYGSYADILRRFDIPCMSKAEYGEMLQRLEHYKEQHGQDSYFGGVLDYSEEITKIENKIERITSGELLVI